METLTPRGQYTKGSRITGATRDKLGADLKRRYEKGASIRALAEATGRSYGFVHRLLSETGVQLRGRGGDTRNRTSNRTTQPASSPA
jgi:hypothetical protein